jgi:hypothetical protein
MNWLRHFSRNRAPVSPDAYRRSRWHHHFTRPWFLWTLGLLITAGVVALLLWLPRLGSWLIIQEPLQTADAIVILGGNLPFRSQVAASLYQQGWAKQVWITAPEGAAETETIKNLGLSSVPQQELSRRVLEYFGVPPLAIRTLSPVVPANTTHEIQLIADALRRTGGRRVILVTSKAHTRRVRAAWNALADTSQQCVVRHIERDVFDPDRWWTTARDRLSVAHETGGLVSIWLTHPIRMMENAL